LSAQTNDHNKVGEYFYDTAATSSFGQTDSLRFKLTVTDGCPETTFSSTSPGNVGILVDEPAKTYSFAFALDLAHCSAVVINYVETCFTDNTYVTSTACPTFVSLVDTTYTADATLLAEIGTYYYQIDGTAATGQTA